MQRRTFPGSGHRLPVAEEEMDRGPEEIFALWSFLANILKQRIVKVSFEMRKAKRNEI